MHEKKRVAMLKLLEDTDVKDADVLYLCAVCQNFMHPSNFCVSGVNGHNFLVYCNACKKTLDEENDRVKEIERIQRNKLRLQQMKDYIKKENSWPEERARKMRENFLK